MSCSTKLLCSWRTIAIGASPFRIMFSMGQPFLWELGNSVIQELLAFLVDYNFLSRVFLPFPKEYGFENDNSLDVMGTWVGVGEKIFLFKIKKVGIYEIQSISSRLHFQFRQWPLKWTDLYHDNRRWTPLWRTGPLKVKLHRR